MRAEKFGSLQARCRIIFIGIRCTEPEFPGGAPWIEQTYNAMQIPQWPCRRFITDCGSQRDAVEKGDNKRMKVDQNKLYTEEHLEAFKAASLEWPPDLGSICHIVDMSDMRRRDGEIAYFAYFAFKDDHQGKPGEILDFYDGNHTLKRLLGKQVVTDMGRDELKSFFRINVPTMTSHSKLVVRTTVDGNVTSMRSLAGSECMRLIGWPETLADKFDDEYPKDLMVSFAGNAFSAFMMGPVISATLACAGNLKKETTQCSTTQPDETSSDLSSSE